MSWSANLTFASPWFFVLLALIPWVLRLRWEQRGRITFPLVGVLAEGPRPGRFTGPAILALRALLLVAIVTALARPQLGVRAQNVTTEGIDIVVTIDVSSSMLAQDFLPLNRLEVAKETVKRFILGRQSDRIALVAFAGEALTQVPLTADYPVLLAAVDKLTTQADGQVDDGTAIGTAIATSANRLRTAPGGSRVVVLLTDGENNRGAIDPRTAADAARAFGIRIYTIGVGRDGVAPVPVSRGVVGLRYEDRPVSIDEPMLRDIAALTGGRYYRATDAQSLADIYDEIDLLERVPVQTRRFARYSEQFRWPLGVAMLFLTIEMLLLIRRAPLP